MERRLEKLAKDDSQMYHASPQGGHFLDTGANEIRTGIRQHSLFNLWTITFNWALSSFPCNYRVDLPSFIFKVIIRDDHRDIIYQKSHDFFI